MSNTNTFAFLEYLDFIDDKHRKKKTIEEIYNGYVAPVLILFVLDQWSDHEEPNESMHYGPIEAEHNWIPWLDQEAAHLRVSTVTLGSQ